MARLTLDASRAGLGDFPAGFEPVARDDLGYVLALDGAGVVWCFAHGMGSWESRAKAFGAGVSIARGRGLPFATMSGQHIWSRDVAERLP